MTGAMRKGFTLIELLVVIAIIAVLAAILFPVFAEAKQAAKATVSLSNIRQQALAAIMYSGDQDDTAMPEVSWHGGYPIDFGIPGSDFAPWCFLIQPYMKNSGIEQDPLGPIQTVPSNWTSQGLGQAWSDYNPEYGYSYTVWSPYQYSSDGVQIEAAPRGMSSAARPADTVLLTAHPSLGEFGGQVWLYSVVSGPILNFGSEPVDCYHSEALCFGNWGRNDPLLSQIANAGHYEQGPQTGENAPRRANKVTSAFGDGHVKTSSVSWLAEGTNFTGSAGGADTDASQIVIFDLSVYHWTAQ